jgi:hypothetical protein
LLRASAPRQPQQLNELLGSRPPLLDALLGAGVEIAGVVI